ncbi:hypothetical protein BaRGS_00004715 [Batillaria attramentaria]|uniref:Uncharacterized protein n=1 Tax=Batillaria attramentaria TaxID=370345 RepID=A0ABD0LY14_9CAEN
MAVLTPGRVLRKEMAAPHATTLNFAPFPLPKSSPPPHPPPKKVLYPNLCFVVLMEARPKRNRELTHAFTVNTISPQCRATKGRQLSRRPHPGADVTVQLLTHRSLRAGKRSFLVVRELCP